MIKDIPKREVTEVGIALIPEDDEKLGTLWVAHLVNLKDQALTNILINVEGKGSINGNRKSTAKVRYLIDRLEPLSAHQIEVLLPEVLEVANQFWVSFSSDNYLFDKKYLIPADPSGEMELIGIPVLHTEGLWFD
jgi:hypothetical protein